MTKKCPKCKKTFPRNLIFFSPRYGKEKGLISSWCRSCLRTLARATQTKRRKDPILRIKLLEEKKRYNLSPKGRESKRRQSETSNHKRRQRHLNVIWDWTVDDWEECKEFWGKICAYCGSGGYLTQDHFIPLADPKCPGTVRSNMVPACMHCDTSKQHHHPDVWVKNKKILRSIKAKLAKFDD